MAKELPKIKPCPRCGGDDIAKIMFMADEHLIVCMQKRCAFAGPIHDTERDSIEAWNRASREGE